MLRMTLFIYLVTIITGIWALMNIRYRLMDYLILFPFRNWGFMILTTLTIPFINFIFMSWYISLACLDEVKFNGLVEKFKENDRR